MPGSYHDINWTCGQAGVPSHAVSPVAGSPISWSVLPAMGLHHQLMGIGWQGFQPQKLATCWCRGNLGLWSWAPPALPRRWDGIGCSIPQLCLLPRACSIARSMPAGITHQIPWHLYLHVCQVPEVPDSGTWDTVNLSKMIVTTPF